MAERDRVLSEMLSESEAALRMMDAILEELQAGDDDGEDAVTEHVAAQVMQRLEAVTAGSTDLTALVMHVYLDVIETLKILRRTRSALERTTVEQVQATQEKLLEVSSTTELAATDLLDGLDRAIGMIDRLDSLAAEGNTEESEKLRAELRDELFRLIVVLQFQDIAAQQLSHASNVLRGVERRLERVVGLLDDADLVSSSESAAGTDAADHAHDRPRGYDPAASMLGAEDRQALADEIFSPAANADG